VALGLDYLRTQNVVHGDLKAVRSNRIPQICFADQGMWFKMQIKPFSARTTDHSGIFSELGGCAVFLSLPAL
jgi:hypothetical protein